MKQNKLDSIKQYFICHQKKILFTLEIFLVVVIASIAWLLENRIFTFFILSFYLFAKFYQHKRSFVLVITPIILYVLFNTQVLDGLLLLTKSDLPSIQHPKAVLNTLFTPNSGLGVLPPQVLNMIYIMNDNDVKTYKLSEDFSADIVIYQRIVEGAWPIKPDDNSTHMLIAPVELEEYKDCLIIDEKEDVILVNCD